jgi:uncharacterized cofD-like protein
MGGGHGLAATLKALRRVTANLTAVVGVGDDGGSSGRIREQFDVVPPGDLRMALDALCGEDTWGRTWSRVVQHRFGGTGDLQGHSLGNLLITALWEETGDVVDGLDWVGSLLGTHGRVLPVSTVPVKIIASVVNLPTRPGREVEVHGQAAVASTQGRVTGLRIEPESPPLCPQAYAAITEADVITVGPGSWYTSVLANLLVPELRDAVRDSAALKVVVLNLKPQPGETSGFAPETHLEVIARLFPGLGFDVVVADPSVVSDRGIVEEAAALLGAQVSWSQVASPADDGVHDSDLLAQALTRVLGRGSIGTWH